ncbi:ejaculatory bulb-specific protein 3-like [Zootermopsis nevadensis]|uniref:Putative odorant-binding protein A10 n=1 Tax=Zootermopsis nevadensis TaxID=136037 RepID=A0A067RFA4_ZOONE|nr:ejaculatory bulb-specific protein 3-like [Zootermopsis nevadensis]KDR22551.1 Putative odorant-binding protein A10 [Zootermopsis nevadensis]
MRHKLAVSLLLVVLGAALAVSAEKPKTYTSKYDNVDVDSILGNSRILTSYIKCMLDEGPCTPDARDLKKTLPDALQTGCEKCNEKQKTTSERVIKHLIKERSKDWDRLVNKFDPKGEYKKRYESLA